MDMTVDSRDAIAIELLAPARNAAVAREAILHGADAVYIGAEGFGARAAAGNPVEEIGALCGFASQFGARVYVTVNTIVYDSELKAVEQLVRWLYRAGVDALIVQDMSLLRLDLPPIALHASTQCDIRTPEKARFLQDVGFSQLVLPRELSLDEIAAIRRGVDVPLEAFVHGALCVSYSGDCQAGWMLKKRSANRGECPQICRLPFDLYDGKNRCVERQRHLLSLKDMNRSGELAEMMTAGISSFKIEGRLKDAGYVKNICAYYRRMIDGVIEKSGGQYRRSSSGTVATNFDPMPEKSFNRGFTNYFIDGKRDKIGSIYTPKSTGEIVGRVLGSEPRVITASLDKPLANGDGLGFFDGSRQFVGFRLNRVEGNRLYPAGSVTVPAGALLYRNSDKAFDDVLSSASATRTIAVDMDLRVVPGGVALDMSDERGNVVTVREEMTCEPARTPQEEARRRVFGKLGDTIYRLREYRDSVGSLFIPAKELTALRRRGLERLESCNRCRRYRELRREENREAVFPGAPELSYHDNVSNRVAAGFYKDHGVRRIQPAAEIADPGRNPVVMTTRYCLRHQLGACLKEGGERRMPEPLTLRSGRVELGLEFDCRNCLMRVVKH